MFHTITVVLRIQILLSFYYTQTRIGSLNEDTQKYRRIKNTAELKKDQVPEEFWTLSKPRTPSLNGLYSLEPLKFNLQH